MVLREEEIALPSYLSLDDVPHEELFLQPKGHGHRKGPEAGWCLCEVRFKEALELEPRLVVETT